MTEKIRANFRLKESTSFSFGNKTIMLNEIIIAFRPETEWYSQIVSLDASLGIYDYLRKQVKIAGGNEQFIVKGINFDKGKKIEFPPDNWKLVFGMQNSGETDLFFVMQEGLDYGNYERFPNLDPLVTPEDLNLQIKNVPA